MRVVGRWGENDCGPFLAETTDHFPYLFVVFALDPRVRQTEIPPLRHTHKPGGVLSLSGPFVEASIARGCPIGQIGNNDIMALANGEDHRPPATQFDVIGMDANS